MQSAKDTFYEVLRGRLAAMNPARTIVVRGVTRAGVLVEENELPSAAVPTDCFRLLWAAMEIETRGPLPLVTLTCEVHYETAGTALAGSLDRGRSLEAMDAELLSAVTSAPRRATKMSYAAEANGGGVKSLNSAVWWSPPAFGQAETRGERLGRVMTMKVMSYQEAGEL